MSARPSYDWKASAEARQRLMEQAADAAVERARRATAKPSLRRYTWSRLHTDLLDDNRWSLVSLRAGRMARHCRVYSSIKVSIFKVPPLSVRSWMKSQLHT